MAVWETKGAGQIAIADVIEGALVYSSGTPLGMALTLHGDLADGSAHLAQPWLLTVDAMSAMIAHVFRAAHQLGPEAVEICQAAITAEP